MFLAGAWLASLTIGLVIVFALDGAEVSSSARGVVNAVIYIPLGLLGVFVGAHLLHVPPKPKKPKKDGHPSMTQRVLTRDSSWIVFVLGIVLNMPGIWYLIGLKDIGLADYSNAAKVLAVVGFNASMFALIATELREPQST